MEQKYIEAERRLAELLGMKPLWVDPIVETGVGYYQDTHPHWCRDNAAAFSLMVEHDLSVDVMEHLVSVGTPWGRSPVIVHQHEAHPDRETAVRYAIVQAVIARLEANIDIPTA